MADAKRLARQWLETEAAFGVAEVPIPASAKRTAPTAASAATRPEADASDVMFAVRQLARPPEAGMPAPKATPQPATRPTPQPALIPDAVRSAASSPMAAHKKVVVALPPAPAGNITDLPPIARRQKEEAFEALRAEIEAASKPYINEVSARVVFGEGDPDAALMFVGEGPGVEEDRTGRPFVGRSGQLLDKMIAAIGYTRAQVFIGNVVKLRCAEWDIDHTKLTDRPPNPEEVARGLPWLHKQIEIIRPKVIVTLGAPAVKYLTGATEGVMKIRGTWLSYRGIPVMPTYHPSFVLRAYTTENRGKVWSDLKAAMAKVTT